MDLQRVTRLFDYFLDYPVDSPVAIARAHGLSCYHFKERSLPDERTDRGLLMVVKDRHVAVNIPLGDRMRWQWRMTREARHGFSKGIFRKKDK